MNEDLIYFKENLDFSDIEKVKQYILALESEITYLQEKINKIVLAL